MCLKWTMFLFLLGICQRVELLGHMLTTLFNLWRNCQFPKVTVPLAFPLLIYMGACFFTNPSTFLIIYIPDYSHIKGYEVVSHSYGLHFLYGEWRWVYFHVLIGHFFIFLTKHILKSFAHFNWVIYLFIFALKSSFLILDTSSLPHICFSNISPILVLAFSLSLWYHL